MSQITQGQHTPFFGFLLSYTSYLSHSFLGQNNLPLHINVYLLNLSFCISTLLEHIYQQSKGLLCISQNQKPKEKAKCWMATMMLLILGGSWCWWGWYLPSWFVFLKSDPYLYYQKCRSMEETHCTALALGAIVSDCSRGEPDLSLILLDLTLMLCRLGMRCLLFLVESGFILSHSLWANLGRRR